MFFAALVNERFPLFEFETFARCGGCDKIGIVNEEKRNAYVGRCCLSAVLRWAYLTVSKPSPEARDGKSSKERFEMQIKTVLDTPAAVKHLSENKGRRKLSTITVGGRPNKAIVNPASGGSSRSSLISYPKSLSEYPYNASASCAVFVFLFRFEFPPPYSRRGLCDVTTCVSVRYNKYYRFSFSS